MSAAGEGIAGEQGADHAGILAGRFAVQGANVGGEIFRLPIVLEVFLVVGLSLLLIVPGRLQEVRHHLIQILLNGLFHCGILRIGDRDRRVPDGDDHGAIVCLDVLADLIAAGQNGSAVSGLGRGGSAGSSAGTGSAGGAGGTCCRSLAAAGGQGEGHDHGKTKGEQSFHPHNLISTLK